VQLAVSWSYALMFKPRSTSAEFLHVLITAVGEGNARALSVRRHRCAVTILSVLITTGLIVQLRELHECHV
jgi:hypothetical protein